MALAGNTREFNIIAGPERANESYFDLDKESTRLALTVAINATVLTTLTLGVAELDIIKRRQFSAA